MASGGAGVAKLLAHMTSVIGSPTHIPELGRSIKRYPNQVSVRFRKVRAKNGKNASAIFRVCTDIVRHAITRMTQSDMTDTTSVKHLVRPTFQVRHVLRNLCPGGETGGDTYDRSQARTALLERG